MSSTLADACLALVDDYTFIKWHIGDPGAAGTANAAANTTRVATTWGAAGAGAAGFRQIANTAAVNVASAPATETYTHFSVWSASTAGTFGFSGTVTGGSVTAGGAFNIAIGALTAPFPIAA